MASEIAVTDRLGCREAPIAEEQEGLALAHTADLAGQRLEIGSGPDDGAGEARLQQHLLEGKLGVLEGELRLLDADGRKQHHMAHPCPPGFGKG